MQKSFGKLAMMGPLVVGVLLSNNTMGAEESMKTNDTMAAKVPSATNAWPWKDATPPGVKIGYINEKIPNLPVFQRDYFRSDTPRMKQVKRFVADKTVEY